VVQFLSRSVDGSVPLILRSAAAVRAVLDCMDANVFIADPQLKLVYANPSAMSRLAEVAGDIRSAFGLKVEDLLGGSIHRFHKNPGNVERILRGHGLPHSASFTFGNVTLRTRIAQIKDERGGTAGFVVVWDDVSAEARQRQEVEIAENELARASSEVADLADRLNGRALAAAEQAGVAAAATEQMSSSIQEISSSTSSAATVAGETVHAAQAVSTSIARLAGSTQDIGGVVALITTIAGQTNLLALNATIEAARAGEAGKGFAVVATEVKELARETSEATDRITSIIGGLTSDSDGATEAIETISALIDRISSGQSDIANALQQQSVATDEISRSVNQVAASAAGTTSDASELASSALALNATVDRLRRLLSHSDL